MSAAAKAARRHDLCFGQLCCAGGGVWLTIAARQRRKGEARGGVAPWTLQVQTGDIWRTKSCTFYLQAPGSEKKKETLSLDGGAKL